MDSQWSSPQALADFQEETVRNLIAHAVRHVPYYRERLDLLIGANGEVDLSKWLQVPVMTRKLAEEHYQDLIAEQVPPEHGPVDTANTSASNGPALTLKKTQLLDTALACAAFRHVEAFGLDWSRPLIMARAMAGQPRSASEDNEEGRLWGPAWLDRSARGKRIRVSVHTRPEKLLDILRENAPAFLNTSPAKVMNLISHVVRSGEDVPEIGAILSVGEHVSGDLRQECRTHLRCEMIDVYSTAECGLLAAQCPEGGGYHMQPELSVLEVLNARGMPCRPGETGRVTATALYNYAMPLIRYQYEDYVTVGSTCSCGRPAPLLSAVLGRSNQQFLLEGGRRVRPEPVAAELRKYIGSRRWQLAQIGTAEAELRIAPHPSTEPLDCEGAAGYIRSLFDVEMNVTTRANAVLGLTGGGKFATVISEYSASG